MKVKYGIEKSIWIIVISTLCLASCELFSPAGIKKIYKNPSISSYKIEKITLLPILPDDSTDHGAYFATNYLFNILDKDYPSLTLTHIDWVREFDCAVVKHQIDQIKRNKRFDLDAFYDTDLGYNIIEEGYDAVLIGTIDSTDNALGSYIMNNNRGMLVGWKTYCSFTYYIASLKNGKILWQASVYGEELNNLRNYYYQEYPPLDYAISNGIERMVDYLPTEIFK